MVLEDEKGGSGKAGQGIAKPRVGAGGAKSGVGVKTMARAFPAGRGTGAVCSARRLKGRGLGSPGPQSWSGHADMGCVRPGHLLQVWSHLQGRPFVS
jgi:hypothetical protein